VITEDAGTVKELLVKEKDPVAEGQVVAIVED
jgi:biotin carboxyl carrier protein